MTASVKPPVLTDADPTGSGAFGGTFNTSPLQPGTLIRIFETYGANPVVIQDADSPGAIDVTKEHIIVAPAGIRRLFIQNGFLRYGRATGITTGVVGVQVEIWTQTMIDDVRSGYPLTL